MLQILVLLFPGARLSKRLTVLLWAPLLMLPAGAQAPGRFVVVRAVRLDISHTGLHTHANFVLFDTGPRNLAAMQRDQARYPRLTVLAHARLDTDHAALPPDLVMPGSPSLENPYGPMDGGRGRPGWTRTLLSQNGRHLVKVSVPTRFANWLALQPAARRKRYLDPRQYWLEVRWSSGER